MYKVKSCVCSHSVKHLNVLLQQLWFPLTPELLDIAMETRVEMLATARNCYWKASKCEADGSEEEWLHHYMMGKVMEKKRAHPRLYLEHYKQVRYLWAHECIQQLWRVDINTPDCTWNTTNR